MTVLREFVVKIKSSTDKKGLTDAKSSLKDIGKTAAFAGAGIAAFAGSAYLLKGFVDSVTQSGDVVIKMSRNLGIAVEEMQRFQYAGNIAGVSNANMTNALKYLNKNISEASEGIGTGKRAFERLGISVIDTTGKLKTNTQVFAEVASSIKNLQKEKRVATLMELFGRTGVNMGNMFLKGSKGVQELFDRFDKLNLALDKDNLKAMEEYNDRVYETSLANNKLKSVFVSALLPVLTRIATTYREKLAKAIEYVSKNTENITKGFEKFIKMLKYAGIAGAAFTIGKISIALSGLASAFSLAGGAAVIAWAKALAAPILIGGAVIGLTLLIDDMWKTFMNPEVATFTRKFLDDFKNKFPTAFEAAKTIINSLRLSLAGLGLMMSKLFGNASQQKIWEDLVRKYGGEIAISAKKAGGISQESGIMDTIRNFPGLKQLYDVTDPIANVINSIPQFLSNITPPTFTMDSGGKSFLIQNVEVTADSGTVDDLINNIEAVTERVR